MPLNRQVNSLRWLRRLLVALAAGTAVSVAAACRLPLPGRLIAGAVALVCLICWTVLLEVEGRTAARVERVIGRRRAPAPVRRLGTTRTTRTVDTRVIDSRVSEDGATIRRRAYVGHF